jgi:DHA1 family bicyclomycin/chloramphenicol resistance-like MFS transporter
MVAAMMGLNAFSIDIILPALPDIGSAFGLTSENAPQLVITAYVFGLGVATLLYGPLSDAFGRRGVLLLSMLGMLACTLACALAPSFWVLLLARAMQGVAAASTRVIAVAVVRDIAQGRRMAEIMSIAMTVFMISPIIAPGAGQLLLFILPWRMVFVALFAAIALIALWIWLRLPETLRPENRTPLSIRSAARSYILVCRNRISLGYTIASGFAFGGMFAFVATSEQVFAQQYGLGAAFPLAFAGIALGMAVASFVNARLVGRIGMRRMSHGALVGFTVLSTAMTAATFLGVDGFWEFYIPYVVALFCFGMIGANFNSLVMEPAGRHAGTMAAVSGAYVFMTGALFGTLIGMAYDGTVLSVVLGNAILGLLSLATVLVVERGRLFTRTTDEH